MFDAVVIGAGISGATIGERLASQGRKVLMVEQRAHLAGNCYDWRDADGVLIHQYGPHTFHTDLREVWAYLSRFTEWLPFEFRVLASIDGSLAPLPFNLDTLHQLYPTVLAVELERLLLERYGFGARMPILRLRESNDSRLNELAEFIYSKIFSNYSRKQWGIDPAELDPQVTGRVPVVVSRDDRYFQDPWQAMPRDGYTAMVGRMLAHPNIKIMLNTTMEEVLAVDLETGAKKLFGIRFAGSVVYTGMIDALFGYCFGRLPYRSLRFELERVDATRRQVAAVINYPNNYDFTRVTDFAHFIGRLDGNSTLMREYPKAYKGGVDGGMPFYPVCSAANQALFERYRAAAEAIPNFYLLGRLANYKYYDMDDAVAAALALAEKHLATANDPSRR